MTNDTTVHATSHEVTSHELQEYIAPISLDKPSVISQDEFQDLMNQIQTEMTISDCQVELMDAARYNDIDIVRALLLCHPNLHEYQDPDTGNTALHMSAANGHVDVVNLLLHLGAKVTETNHVGNTPLHWAASNGQEKVVTLLLRPPPRQNQQNQHQESSDETESLVLVDVLQRNNFGRSVLTEGFSSDNTTVIRSLLEHESASEERLLQTNAGSENTQNSANHATASSECKHEEQDENSTTPFEENDSVTHNFAFGIDTQPLVPLNHAASIIKLSVRELPIAKSDQDSIFGQNRNNADVTGLGIWPASLVCAHWLSTMDTLPLVEQRNNSSGAISSSTTNWWHGKTVLELGAGCGCPGLVAAKAGAAHVILTDLNARTVNNQKHNIILNQVQDKVTAMFMDWDDPTTWPRDKVDVLVGSDLVYDSVMVPVLLRAIRGLLKHSGIFLYVCPDTGRDGREELLLSLQQQDFEVLFKSVAPPDYRKNPLENHDDEAFFLHFFEILSTQYDLYAFQWKKEIIKD